jgi:hypothetical protein
MAPNAPLCKPFYGRPAQKSVDTTIKAPVAGGGETYVFTRWSLGETAANNILRPALDKQATAERLASRPLPIPQAAAQANDNAAVPARRRPVMTKGGTGSGGFGKYTLGEAVARGPRAARIDAETASVQLRGIINDFFGQAADWLAAGRPEDEVPACAIRGAAGLGKTTASLAALKERIDAGEMARGLYLTPTTKLGRELKKAAEDLGLPMMSVLGRAQPTPESEGERMCPRHANAAEASKLGLNVYETMCKSKDGARICPHFETCGYLRQQAAIREFAGVLVGSHQYLTSPLDGLRADGLDMLIVDENHDQTLIVADSLMDIAEFTQPRAQGGSYGGRAKRGDTKDSYAARESEANADFNYALNMLAGVLRTVKIGRDDAPLAVEDFLEAGLTAELCDFAATFEYSRIDRDAPISPDMDAADQAEALAAVERSNAFRNARVWRCLADALRSGRMTGFQRQLGYVDRKAKGQVRDVIRLHYARPIKISGVPTLILDGNLNPHALERFYPAAAANLHHIAPGLRNSRVVQVHDKVFSNQWLANPSNMTDLWEFAVDAALEACLPRDMGVALARMKSDEERKALLAQRAVLITTKAVEDWYASQGLIEAAGEKHTPKRDSLPFVVAHLGDLRGRDEFKSCRVIIVAGRLQPGVEEVEAMARAMFAGTDTGLAFIEADERGNRAWPTRKEVYTLADGSERTMDTEHHPDERVNAVLAAVREGELVQALSRARLIHRGPENPCSVFMLCNIPLPGVEVDELVRWADLIPCRTQIALNRGVLPVLAADCLAANTTWNEDGTTASALWPSYAAIRQDRSRLLAAQDGTDYADLRFNELLAATLGGRDDMIMVDYERERTDGTLAHGSAAVAVYPGDQPRHIVARLKAVLPDARKVRVRGAIPSLVDAPEAHAALVDETATWLAFDLNLDDSDTRMSPRQARAADNEAPPPDTQ